MTKCILHLDMDSFFASVEQQANPRWRNKPLGVIKGEGRTCIIAASREAKKLGIKTGTTIYEARRICPSIVLVPADFDKYFSVTQSFIEICSRYSPDWEIFSIDELFLDVTETQSLFGGVSAIVRKIKKALREEVGEYITCSIGVSYNRLLAKLASEINKPDGVFEITLDNRDEILFKTKLSAVCGLGRRLEQKLLEAGITDFKSLRAVPEECLLTRVGPFWTKELKRMAWGEDDSLLTRVGEIPKAKSVSRTYTLRANTQDRKIIRATLRSLCEEAAFKAREMGLVGRLVGLAVRGPVFVEGNVAASSYKHKTLRYPVDAGGDVFEIAWELLQEMKWLGDVRFLGVWLSQLIPKQNQNLSLLPEEQKKENLITAMDKVNKRFGELTLYPGIILRSEWIKSEINGFLGDKAYRFGRV